MNSYELKAQFNISYAGETSFFLDGDCSAVFNLDGVLPVVTSDIPGAAITIDSLDAILTGYEFDQMILGEDQFDVYFRYEDDQGNDSLFVFEISFEDTIAPQLELEVDTIYLTCPDELPSLAIYLVDDNCDVAGGVSLNNFPLQDLPDYNCGPTIIEVTNMIVAEDFYGNKDTLFQTVYMEPDTIGPTAIVPNDTTINCVDDLNVILSNGWIDGFDNCGADLLSVDSSFLIVAGACSGDFVYKRFWTLTDSCGNVSIDSQMITVLDDLAPVFTVPSDTVVSCGVNLDPSFLGTPTALVDECSGIFEVTYQDVFDTLSCPSEQLLTRIWSVSDSCMNIAIDTQQIQIIDTLPPMFTGPPSDSIFLLCDQLAALDTIMGPSGIVDACSSFMIDTTDIIINQSCINTYEIERTYYIEDACSNVDSVRQNIFVIDSIPPVFSVSGSDFSVACSSNINLDSLFSIWITNYAGATAVDACTIAADLNWTVLNAGTNDPALLDDLSCDLSPGILLNQSFDFVVEDDCGNQDKFTQSFEVIDTSAPIISYCGADINISAADGLCGANLDIPAPFAIDNCMSKDTVVNISQTEILQASSDGQTIIFGLEFSIQVPNTSISPISDLSMTLTLDNVDAEGPEEFMYIYGEDGVQLGTTSPSNMQCGVSQTQFTIPLALFTEWAIDGIIEIELEPNIPSSGIDNGINPICGVSTATIDISYDAISSEGLSYFYAFDGGVFEPLGPAGLVSEFLDVGLHNITFRILDCGSNSTTCSSMIEVVDEEAPLLSCPSSVDVFLTADSCQLEVPLILPTFIEDNCNPGLLNQIDLVSQYLPFAGNANLGLSVADTVWLNFTGISSNQVGDATLQINLQGDVDQAGEYYSVFYVDGSLIGSTEIGGGEVTSGSCSEASIINLTLDQALIESNVVNGSLDIILIANNPFFPGVDENGINPCDDLINLNGIQIDSISEVSASLIYNTWNLEYYLEGPPFLGTVPITDISANYSELLTIGEHDIFFIGTDAAGNSDTCSYTIDLKDAISPNMLCDTFTIIDFNSLNISPMQLEVNQFDNGSFDNCGLSSLFISPTEIDCSDANNGSVIVTLTGVDDSGNQSTCSSELLIQETIALNPVYAAICNGDTLLNVSDVCLSDSLFLFSNVSSSVPDLLSYKWYNPDNIEIASGSNPVIPVVSGVFESGFYRLEVNGPDFCTQTISFPISFSDDLPEPEIQASVPGLICAGTNVDLIISNYSVLADAAYDWYKVDEFGQEQLIGTTSTPKFNLGNALDAGIHCYTVEVNKDCCSASSLLSYCIEIVEQPVAVLNDTMISICRFDDLELSVLQSNNPDWVYSWSGPGIPVGTSGITALVEGYNPNMAGLFPVNLEVFDSILPSCAILPLEIQVEVLEKPATPSLTSDSELVCEGAEVTFTASGDFTGVTAYFFIGDEVFGSADPEFTFIDIQLTDQTDYRVVTAGNGCTSDTSNLVTLDVIPIPVAEIISEEEICSSESSYDLEASFQTDHIYTWTLPGGEMENGFKHPINNPVSGIYYLDVDNGYPGCQNSDTLILTVSNNPEILSLEDNVPDCYQGPDFVMELSYESDSDMLLVEQWLFDGDLIGTDSLLNISSPGSINSGSYTLVLFDTITNCSSDSISIILDIPEELPVLDSPSVQADDYIFCENEAVLFQTNPISNDSLYLWNFDQGALIIETIVPELLLSDINDYDFDMIQVQYLTEDNCLSELSNSTIYEILVLPELDVTYESTVCANESIDISVLNCIGLDGSIDWELPGNTVIEDACQINDQQSVSNTYTYSFMYEELGCESDIYTFDITVNALPTLVDLATPFDSLCLDLAKPIELFLENPEPGVDYALIKDGVVLFDFDSMVGPASWELQNTLIPSMSEQLVEFEVVGMLGSCISEDTASIEVTIFNQPDNLAFISMDTFRYCENDDSFELIADLPPAEIQTIWSSIGSSDPIFISPQEAITKVDGLDPKVYYDFEWSLTYGACEDYSRDTASLYIAVQEQAFVGLDIDTCLQESIFVSAQSSVNIPALGFWTQPLGQQSIVTIPGNTSTFIDLNPNTQTEYEFYWNLPDYGCGASSDTLNVRLLNEFPMIEDAVVDICGDGTFQLNGIEPIDYEGVWSSPDQNIVFQDVNLHNTNVSNLVEGANVFYFEFLNGVCGLDYREELLVNYTFLPEAIDDIVAIEFPGTSVLIDVLLNDFNSDLDFDQFTIVTEPEHGSINLDQNTARYFSDQNYVGVDSFKYELQSNLCGSSSIATVYVNIGENANCDYIPNIITPNEDGFNDTFMIPCNPKYPDSNVQIFNIWGDKVFEQTPYDNEWDGGSLPTGTYYYVVKFSPNTKELIGFLHIQR